MHNNYEFLSSYSANSSKRPTFAEVNLKVIQENYQVIKKHVAPSKVMAVLKANAYGHGIVPVAKHLESFGADYFGISLLEEGILLRKAGIKTPILVFGGINYQQIDEFIKHDLTITATSDQKLLNIEKAARKLSKKAKVHIQFDIGMNRVGFRPDKIVEIFQLVNSLENIKVEGLYSHFSESESEDLNETRKQLKKFNSAINKLKENKISLPPILHISNSGSIYQLPEANFDCVRLGSALYGYEPAMHLKNKLAIKPALTWKSKIIYFKVIPAGAKVSYGSTWTAKEKTRIVTIPVGYGDGYPLALSNKGKVIIKNKTYEIVGKVCMDQILVNINWDEAFNGDEVILLGSSEAHEINAWDIAKNTSNNPREVLCAISARVPRVYIED